jgi:hypothetical protein
MSKHKNVTCKEFLFLFLSCKTSPGIVLRRNPESRVFLQDSCASLQEQEYPASSAQERESGFSN